MSKVTRTPNALPRFLRRDVFGDLSHLNNFFSKNSVLSKIFRSRFVFGVAHESSRAQNPWLIWSWFVSDSRGREAKMFLLRLESSFLRSQILGIRFTYKYR
jgi:hypothetical protein